MHIVCRECKEKAITQIDGDQRGNNEPFTYIVKGQLYWNRRLRGRARIPENEALVKDKPNNQDDSGGENGQGNRNWDSTI